jgi:hypothetical protein
MPATTKTKKKSQPKVVDRTATPFTGPTTVDATPIAPLLVDLPQGAMQGLRKALAGIDEVVTELATQVPLHGAEVGISPAAYQSFVSHTNTIAQLKAIGAPVLKLAEVITETLAVHEDARDQDLGQMVDAIQSTMKRKKNAGAGAPFQKTLAYRAQSAQKAASTRRKNAAAKAAAPK